MRTQRIVILLLLSLLPVSLSGQEQAKAPLNNEEIIQMVGNDLPENVVIGSISANDANFDVSPNALLALKKANVSERIIEAMLSAEAKKRDGAHMAAAQTAGTTYASAPRMGAMGVPIMNSPGARSPVQLPKVMFILGDKKLPLQPSSTEIAQSKGKGGSKAGGVFKGFGKGMMMAGGGMPSMGDGGRTALPGVAYTWALPGRNSLFVLPSHLTNFEIEFSDIPGIDPDSYEPVIVKLIQTKDNWRLVETSKDKFDKHGNDTRSTKTEDKTPVKVTTLGRGHLQVAPISELALGEYGLVLHPKKNQKEFAGVPAPNADALFYSVWDFSIASVESAATATAQRH
jgi:hypothetical protein